AAALSPHRDDTRTRLLEILRARREPADVLEDGEAVATAPRFRRTTPRGAGRLAGPRIHPRRGDLSGCLLPPQCTPCRTGEHGLPRPSGNRRAPHNRGVAHGA